jgi:hypothetical protein
MGASTGRWMPAAEALHSGAVASRLRRRLRLRAPPHETPSPRRSVYVSGETAHGRSIVTAVGRNGSDEPTGADNRLTRPQVTHRDEHRSREHDREDN